MNDNDKFLVVKAFGIAALVIAVYAVVLAGYDLEVIHVYATVMTGIATMLALVLGVLVIRPIVEKGRKPYVPKHRWRRFGRWLANSGRIGYNWLVGRSAPTGKPE